MDGDPYLYTQMLHTMGATGVQVEELYTLTMDEFESVGFVWNWPAAACCCCWGGCIGVWVGICSTRVGTAATFRTLERGSFSMEGGRKRGGYSCIFYSTTYLSPSSLTLASLLLDHYLAFCACLSL